jgi:hypothetical protein
MGKARQARRLARRCDEREAFERDMSVADLRYWRARLGRWYTDNTPVQRAFGDRIEEIAAKRRIALAPPGA